MILNNVPTNFHKVEKKTKKWETTQPPYELTISNSKPTQNDDVSIVTFHIHIHTYKKAYIHRNTHIHWKMHFRYVILFIFVLSSIQMIIL